MNALPFHIITFIQLYELIEIVDMYALHSGYNSMTFLFSIHQHE